MAEISTINKEQKTVAPFTGADPQKDISNKVQSQTGEKTKEAVDTSVKDQKVGQTINESEGQQTEKLYDLASVTKNLTPKKAIKLFGILILLVMIILALYVRFIRKTPVRPVPTLVNVPTPSFSPIQKFKPSIYAEDPNFKKIDEGFGVLENEVKNVNIEERSLLPPTLDFDVIFK